MAVQVMRKITHLDQNRSKSKPKVTEKRKDLIFKTKNQSKSPKSP